MRRHRQSEMSVRRIRRLHSMATQTTLARAFGTCQSNISCIVNRVTWRHVRG